MIIIYTYTYIHSLVEDDSWTGGIDSYSSGGNDFVYIKSSADGKYF